MATLEIKNCRLCGGMIDEIFSFGSFYISTFVENPQDNIGSAPLILCQCKNCKLIQLKHSASQELLYSGKYWYRSSLNNKIVSDLQDIVEKAVKIVNEGIFLDIGANDGTLLSFVPNHFKTIAIEPAFNLQEELKTKCGQVISKFWEETVLEEKANIITAIGMFYDAENPNIFVSNVKKHLAEDGLFIAQMMTLKPMIDKNDLGNICHEHLEYYSYDTLKFLFEKNGLEIFKIEENDINGGSYRLYARHYKNGSIEYPEEIDIKKFIENIEKNKFDVVSFINKVNQENKKVYAYGASTKGNTILQYYGLTDKNIKGIIDINPEKIGKYAVGTEIKVVSDEFLEDADYCLILPWGFKDYFLEKEKKYKGKWITHTPLFEII